MGAVEDNIITIICSSEEITTWGELAYFCLFVLVSSRDWLINSQDEKVAQKLCLSYIGYSKSVFVSYIITIYMQEKVCVLYKCKHKFERENGERETHVKKGKTRE